MEKIKNLKTSILLKVGEKKYKVVHLKFSKDGSIYVFFPKFGGYYVVGQVDVPTPVRGTTHINLDKIDCQIDDPYISYHSGSRLVHINSKDGRYKSDVEILDMGEGNDLVFPMCQILFSLESILYFDEVVGSGYYKTLIIECDRSLSGISIEIWGHPSRRLLDLDTIPLKAKRALDDNMLSCASFNQESLGEYTCTALITECNVLVDKNTKPGLTISVPSQESYIFDLKPKGAVHDFRLVDIGRNDNCFCKSEKKFKKCCGKFL